RDIDGGKNAASKGKKMGGENELRLGNASVLEDFGRVTVREKIVGLEILVELDEVKVAARFFAGSAGARLTVADHGAGGRNPKKCGERAQGENNAGGVATGVGDESRGFDLVSVELRDAVDGLRKQIGIRSGKLVPGCEGVSGLEAKSAAEVNDSASSGEKLRGNLGGDCVGRGEERGAGSTGRNGINGERAEGRLGGSTELRKDFADTMLAGGVAQIEDRTLDGGMAQEETRQLETGVS